MADFSQAPVYTGERGEQQTKALAVKQKAGTIQRLLESDEVKAQLARAIPKTLTVDRLLRVTMTAIRTNPKLLDCTQQSLMACVMGCAELGLEPEPFLGQAYLVPFWNNKRGVMEAQLIPGYRGYLSLARRSGEVQSVQAQVVYKNDRFELTYGLEERLVHEPAEGERGAVKGAYCIFRYKDGSYSMDYMSVADIEKIRARSKAKDFGPWKTDYAEMAKKTVVRRHVKLAPLSVESVEIAKAAAAENLALSGDSQVSLFAEADTEAEQEAEAIDISPEPEKDEPVPATAEPARSAQPGDRFYKEPDPAPPSPPSSDDPTHEDNWKLLRSKNFEKYLSDHAEAFKAADEATKRAVMEKGRRMFDKDWLPPFAREKKAPHTPPPEPEALEPDPAPEPDPPAERDGSDDMDKALIELDEHIEEYGQEIYVQAMEQLQMQTPKTVGDVGLLKGRMATIAKLRRQAKELGVEMGSEGQKPEGSG